MLSKIPRIPSTWGRPWRRQGHVPAAPSCHRRESERGKSWKEMDRRDFRRNGL